MSVQPEAEIQRLRELLPLAASDRDRLSVLMDLRRFADRLAPDEAERYLRETAALARKLGAMDEMARAWTGLAGLVFRTSGNLDVVAECAAAVQEAAKITGSLQHEGRYNYLNGQICQARGELTRARECYERCLERWRADKYTEGVGAVLNALGGLLVLQGNPAEALSVYQECLRMDEERGDEWARARHQYNAGHALQRLGRWEDAVESFNRSIAASERLGIPALRSHALNALGELFLERDKVAKAIDTFQLVVNAGRQMEALPEMLREALGNLGRAYHRQGDLARAAAVYEEALKLTTAAGDNRELAVLLWRTAELAIDQGQLDRSRDLVERSAALSMASGLKGELGEARRIQGLLFAARAEPERAKDSFEEALEILADLEDSVELARARFHYGRFLMAEGEREIGRSHLKAAYRAFRKLGTVAEAEEVNRLLFRQEMRADGDMALLQAVSGLSTLGLEPRALIERALSLLREAMGFESGAILLGDRPFFVQGAPDLQSESARSIHPAVQATDRVLSWPVRFGVGLVGRIYLERSRPAPANQNPLVLETLANLVAAPLSRLAEVLVPQVEEAGRLPGLRYRGVIGSSAAINSLLSLVSRVAQQNVPVLIRGESGTGKELVARALHDSGPRAGKPFVAVNCAAVPENLLEAEFFGVDKGAATGVASRKGKFEVADGGTVFLDEIGDMSPALQAKLLRVLQDKTFERVGGVNPISVDVRIVAATNRTVSALIEERKFREDLYYRLNTVELVVPPLRERREDIPRLVRHFVQRSSHEFGRGVTDVSPEAMARLVAQSWPGNIRELEHAVERAVLLAHGDTVNVEDLPQWLQSGPSADAAGLRLARKEAQVKAATEVESAAVLACLEKAAWNVNRAAELAGYSRAQFYRLMKRHNITRPPASSSSD